MTGQTAPIPVPRVEVVRADDLGDELRARVIELCSVALGMDWAWLLRPPGSTHVLAYSKETLVGHACWLPWSFGVAGMGQLPTAYVEGVAVDPSWQRQGIGRLVMQRLARETAGYQLGVLWTEVPGFYERLGWERWRGRVEINNAQVTADVSGQIFMICRTPLTPPLDPGGLVTAEWREGELW